MTSGYSDMGVDIISARLVSGGLTNNGGTDYRDYITPPRADILSYARCCGEDYLDPNLHRCTKCGLYLCWDTKHKDVIMDIIESHKARVRYSLFKDYITKLFKDDVLIACQVLHLYIHGSKWAFELSYDTGDFDTFAVNLNLYKSSLDVKGSIPNITKFFFGNKDAEKEADKFYKNLMIIKEKERDIL